MQSNIYFSLPCLQQMKHERAEIYCHTRPIAMRCRLTVKPFLDGESAQTRLPGALNRPSLVISSQKISINNNYSPVRKGSGRWPNQTPDGVLVLPKMKTTAGAGTKLTKTAANQRKNNTVAVDPYLQEQDQLRQRQRIEVKHGIVPQWPSRPYAKQWRTSWPTK